MTDNPRSVALSLHVGRPAALAAAEEFIRGMAEHGVECLLKPEHHRAIAERGSHPNIRMVAQGEDPDCELMVVFGGDGSILRAAEWAMPHEIPVLGVNLGHVGFLAELDSSEIPTLIQRVVERRYNVEERMTIETIVRDRRGGREVWRSFAINEVSLEKLARERMIEVLVKVDGRPLSRWGTDGVLVATPTGSTAYAFSANGPVVWPDLLAMLLVPLSAHALFNRPLVLGPKSVVSMEMVTISGAGGVVWCDGRRSTDVSVGMEIEVHLGDRRLLLARMNEAPFVTRLVRKFNLPIDGWRGAGDQGPTPG